MVRLKAFNDGPWGRTLGGEVRCYRARASLSTAALAFLLGYPLVLSSLAYHDSVLRSYLDSALSQHELPYCITTLDLLGCPYPYPCPYLGCSLLPLPTLTGLQDESPEETVKRRSVGDSAEEKAAEWAEVFDSLSEDAQYTYLEQLAPRLRLGLGLGLGLGLRLGLGCPIHVPGGARAYMQVLTLTLTLTPTLTLTLNPNPNPNPNPVRVSGGTRDWVEVTLTLTPTRTRTRTLALAIAGALALSLADTARCCSRSPPTPASCVPTYTCAELCRPYTCAELGAALSVACYSANCVRCAERYVLALRLLSLVCCAFTARCTSSS